jgi:hypothetical protein
MLVACLAFGLPAGVSSQERSAAKYSAEIVEDNDQPSSRATVRSVLGSRPISEVMIRELLKHAAAYDLSHDVAIRKEILTRVEASLRSYPNVHYVDKSIHLPTQQFEKGLIWFIVPLIVIPAVILLPPEIPLDPTDIIFSTQDAHAPEITCIMRAPSVAQPIEGCPCQATFFDYFAYEAVDDEISNSDQDGFQKTQARCLELLKFQRDYPNCYIPRPDPILMRSCHVF